MKIENKKGLQSGGLIDDNIGCYGDMMSFGEIGLSLGISESEAQRIFSRAMRKLKSPAFARMLWNYNEIGETPHINDMAGTGH